jgi:hypothetical protein
VAVAENLKVKQFMGSHLQQSESKVMLKDLNIERQLDEDAAKDKQIRSPNFIAS